MIDPPSDKISHVYTKQHDTRGLQSRYRGPFPILSRPTRSTIIVKVGTNKNNQDRTELRHWLDVKSAYLREGAQDAERPKRGRPPKVVVPPNSDPSPTPEDDNGHIIDSSTASDQNKSDEAPSTNLDLSQPFHGFATQSPNIVNSNEGGSPSSRSVRSTRNQSPNYVDALVASIDFSKPPPDVSSRARTWTASETELNAINNSISGRSW